MDNELILRENVFTDTPPAPSRHSPVEHVRGWIRYGSVDGRLSRSGQSGMRSRVTIHGTVATRWPLVVIQPAERNITIIIRLVDVTMARFGVAFAQK